MCGCMTALVGTVAMAVVAAGKVEPEPLLAMVGTVEQEAWVATEATVEQEACCELEAMAANAGLS